MKNWKDYFKKKPLPSKKTELYTADGTPIKVLAEEHTDLPMGFSAKIYENGLVDMYKKGEFYGSFTKETYEKLLKKYAELNPLDDDEQLPSL